MQVRLTVANSHLACLIKIAHLTNIAHLTVAACGASMKTGDGGIEHE